VTLGAAGLAAVPSAAHGADKGRIVFGQGFTRADVYRPLIKGAKEAGKRRGYEVLESFDEGDASKQIAEINTWIAQKVDALTILPLNEKAMTPLRNKAHKAGIKWVTYAGSEPGEDGYVWWDNIGGGADVAAHMAKWIKKTFKPDETVEVALFTADFFLNGRQRVHGTFDALKKLAPNVKVVAQQQAILAAESFKTMQSVMQAHPNVNAVICIADDGALGAERAFTASRPSKDRMAKMYITGFDGSRVAMKRVLAGSVIRSVAALPLKKIGNSAIDVPANILEGKQPTKIKHKYVLVSLESAAAGRKLIADFE
jgi:ribose transport system substrate-binding protein